jgi:hypothetical protein
VELRRLDPPAVAAMAGDCLGGAVLAAGLVGFLDPYAERRPFFVEEILAGVGRGLDRVAAACQAIEAFFG